MKKNLSVIFFFLLSLTSLSTLHAQDYHITDSLKHNLEIAKTNEAKIQWLGELATFYMNLNQPLSEKYGNQQLEIAETSRDRKLMLKALLSNALRYFNSNGVQENINKSKKFSRKALDLAKSSHADEYTAWAYLYLARAARSEGEDDKSLNYSTLASSLAASVNNDSLKISVYNSFGDTYLNRRENLLAFRNYLQAMNIAEDIHNYRQMRNCYYNLADFYTELEDYEKSKDYLFKVQQITHEFNQPYDRMNLYRNLGRIYSRNKQYDIATQYFEKLVLLCDTIQLEVGKLNAYFDIINQYLESNQGAKAISYFQGKPELKQFLEQAGYDFYLNQTYASAYSAMGKYDSAVYYFKKAEVGFESKTGKFNKYYFYKDYASFLEKKGDHKKALEYWLKAKKIGEETHNISFLKDTYAKLDSTYQKLGDYHNALYYNAHYHLYKDSLTELSTEKDVLLLEVDNENRIKEKELLKAEEATRAWHNVQYMGITAAIASVFIVLIMLGTFSVSKGTIRILGFFAFIFLFEFLILLADNQIHHWTHGEPWKVLLIKIGLISVLLPLHHYLEEKAIHYLTSRKLMEVNKNLLSRLSRKQEANAALKD
jgi:tetratricopeptide (TPR) repeat protein